MNIGLGVYTLIIYLNKNIFLTFRNKEMENKVHLNNAFAFSFTPTGLHASVTVSFLLENLQTFYFLTTITIIKTGHLYYNYGNTNSYYCAQTRGNLTFTLIKQQFG